MDGERGEGDKREAKYPSAWLALMRTSNHSLRCVNDSNLKVYLSAIKKKKRRERRVVM